MKTLLVPVDFSDATDAVIAEAGSLAKALGARVVLEHVLVPPRNGYELPPEALQILDTVKPATTETLSNFGRLLEVQGIAVEPVVRRGEAGPSILDDATQFKSDYIVLGSHGHGALYHMLVGGTAEEVIKHAPCPVVLVPARPKS